MNSSNSSGLTAKGFEQQGVSLRIRRGGQARLFHEPEAFTGGLADQLVQLDNELADNRPYLVGDRFSRADMTVASLLVPAACPEEIPAYRGMSIPDALIADFERWQRRPVMRWVKEQYEAHRAPMLRAA